MSKEISKPRAGRGSARDVFSYLLMIVMLYVGVITFIAMLWQYTNIQFPDALEYYRTGSFAIIRNSISSLLVVWPVFILMSWLIGKDIKADFQKKNLAVRKWLLYLTLFVASLTIIIDLITLMNSFLSGELTTRFVLKVIIILAVAASVFGYYLWELKRDPSVKTSLPLNSAITSSIAIVVFVVIGFFIVGTPSQQREVRMDEQRVQNLQSIQFQLLNYWQQKDFLPTELSALNDSLAGFVIPVDPITGDVYSYKTTSDLSFELCATFATESSDPVESVRYPATKNLRSPIPLGFSENWNHKEGLVCFERTIDPDLYRE